MKQIDRIRNMNAEELAEMLTDIEIGESLCGERDYVFTNYKLWLESEVEE